MPTVRTILGWCGTLGCAIAIGSGCADNRISIEELYRLEQASAQAEPVGLEPAALALTELHPYTVGPGDVLVVTLTGLGEQYSQTDLHLRVHDDGTVTLPMVGRIHVAGLDLKGVEQAIYDAHVPSRVKDMAVFARLDGTEPTTVMVVGAAGQSGVVRLPRNERNIIYALSRAAAFTPAGSGRVHVRPVRPDRPEVTYDLTDINDLRRALLAPPLESGDMIVVEPAPPSAIYVTGLVNVPAPVPVPPQGSLSLVRTLAAAGGLRDFLDPSEATLWRRLPDGQQVRVKLDLDAVLEGKAPDIALKPGDVLDVPHTAATRLREWWAANVRLGPFGVTSMYDPVADRRARILRNDNPSIVEQAFLSTLSSGMAGLMLNPALVTPPP